MSDIIGFGRSSFNLFVRGWSIRLSSNCSRMTGRAGMAIVPLKVILQTKHLNVIMQMARWPTYLCYTQQSLFSVPAAATLLCYFEFVLQKNADLCLLIFRWIWKYSRIGGAKFPKAANLREIVPKSMFYVRKVTRKASNILNEKAGL